MSIIMSIIKVKHRFFEKKIFSSTITECTLSINNFKQNFLKFIRLGSYKVFNMYNSYGLKLLTILSLDLSHLRGHKFKHNFICLHNQLSYVL